MSEPIFNDVYKGKLKNLLIVGPPSSGKTTMLRDLAFQLSSGRMGKYHKICVVDERKELFPSQLDIKSLGPNPRAAAAIDGSTKERLNPLLIAVLLRIAGHHAGMSSITKRRVNAFK